MIGVEINRVVYKGDGQATEFPFNFTILDKSEIIVTLVDPDREKKELKTDYFVDMDRKAVIYPGYAPGEEPAEAERPPALPNGWYLVLQRKVRIDQLTSLGDKWPFDVTEDALDKITRILQDINTDSARHLELSPEVDGVNPTLPKPEPNKGFYWDETGTKLISADNPNLAAEKASERASTAIGAAERAERAESITEKYKNESGDNRKAAADHASAALESSLYAAESARVAREKREDIEVHEENASISAEAASASAALAADYEESVLRSLNEVQKIEKQLSQQAQAYDSTRTYNYPDVVAYVDGYTYRCIGINIRAEPPDSSNNWKCLTNIIDDFFDIDDEGNLIPNDNPTFSILWDLDENGNIVAKEE